MKKFIYGLIIFLVIPFIAQARGGISVSTQSLNIVNGNTATFTISASNAAGRVDISTSNGGVARISSGSEFLDNSSATITVTGLSVGNAVITVRATDVTTYDDETVGTTYTIAVNVSAPYVQSTNNNLNSLSVSGCNINFNPGTTSYSCPEVDTASVSVSASVQDGKARITSGTGNRALNFGNNSLRVVVRAENGSTKTYTINIRRSDTRNGDNTLVSLGVLGQEIDFKPDVNDYYLTVANGVETALINATATASTSTVSGTGSINLQIGENRIPVTVTAENGDTRVYTIIINRSEVENIPSTKLVSFKANGKALNLTTGKKSFMISIDEGDSVELELETSSKTTQYEVAGNEKLVPGVNLIKIKASDEDCETVTYELIVYKNREDATRVNNLADISELTGDITYNSSKYGEQLIPDNLVKAINDSDNKLIYNVVDENDGVYYSFLFNKSNNLSGEFEINFLKASSNPLTFISNIPNGVLITAYVGKDVDEKSLMLYGYDQKSNTYNLIKDKVLVENGYVSFVADGSNQYVFSKSELKNKSGFKVGTLFVGIGSLTAGALIGVLVVFFIIKKRKGDTPKLAMNTGGQVKAPVNQVSNKKVNTPINNQVNKPVSNPVNNQVGPQVRQTPNTVVNNGVSQVNQPKEEMVQTAATANPGRVMVNTPMNNTGIRQEVSSPISSPQGAEIKVNSLQDKIPEISIDWPEIPVKDNKVNPVRTQVSPQVSTQVPMSNISNMSTMTNNSMNNINNMASRDMNSYSSVGKIDNPRTINNTSNMGTYNSSNNMMNNYNSMNNSTINSDLDRSNSYNINTNRGAVNNVNSATSIRGENDFNRTSINQTINNNAGRRISETPSLNSTSSGRIAFSNPSREINSNVNPINKEVQQEVRNVAPMSMVSDLKNTMMLQQVRENPTTDRNTSRVVVNNTLNSGVKGLDEQPRKLSDLFNQQKEEVKPVLGKFNIDDIKPVSVATIAEPDDYDEPVDNYNEFHGLDYVDTKDEDDDDNIVNIDLDSIDAVDNESSNVEMY